MRSKGQVRVRRDRSRDVQLLAGHQREPLRCSDLLLHAEQNPVPGGVRAPVQHEGAGARQVRGLRVEQLQAWAVHPDQRQRGLLPIIGL